MERYTKILDLHKRLIQNNCHIIFDKGALLKDNRNDKNILQLQFLNIGNKQVKAVYVAIECLSIEDELLETVDFEYLDLAVKYGDVFGSNIPITINNPSCRKFNFRIRKLLYEDSSIVLDGRMEELPVNDDLNDFGDLKEQFIREVKAIDYKIVPVIKPTKNRWDWHCTCGNLNYYENEKCGKCGINKEQLFSITDEKYLSEKKALFLEKQQAKIASQEKEQQTKKEQRIKKYKKLIKIGIVLSVTLVVCTLMYWFVVPTVKPKIRYHQMMKCVEHKKYDEAYYLLSEIRNYSYTPDEIRELAHDFGDKCINDSEIRLAINFLNLADGYEDSDELYKKASYMRGVENYENSEFKEAIEDFKKANDYEDAEIKLVEVSYIYGLRLLDDKEYKKAIVYLETAKEYGYKDAEEKLYEAKYGYVKDNLESGNYNTKVYLEELRKTHYKDAELLYKKLY